MRLAKPSRRAFSCLAKATWLSKPPGSSFELSEILLKGVLCFMLFAGSVHVSWMLLRRLLLVESETGSWMRCCSCSSTFTRS